MASSSMASKIKAYSVPLILFFGAVFYQLVVIPKSFPHSHYDVLGIKKYSSIDEVTESYEKLSSNWNSSVDIPVTQDFLKLQYAYELLMDPSRKRNYDIFGIDEHLDVLKKAKERFLGQKFSTVDLPLLDSASSDTDNHSLNATTSSDIQSMFESNKPLLIQLFSHGSKSCSQFSDAWGRIGSLLDGVANTASVELGDLQLVAYLAEKQPTGRPFFRNGIPSLVAFPPGCKTVDCLIRYNGELSVDAVTDWFSTNILGLPRIFYYAKESLGPKFLATVSSHKVKVIIFSKTGERGSPFVRQAAKNYWSHASFAFVLWREEEASFWFNTFEVESAPAIVFLKDPGAKPVVYHGAVNNTLFSSIMEQNKNHELPQLRGSTSAALGCDPRGFSRSGIDTSTWYCAIVAGRHSPELSKMREAVRKVKTTLSQDSEPNEHSIEPAAAALQNKRLTFAWLDGEEEKKYCFFYVNTETSFETCGTRRDITDVPQLFIVRYKRNATEDNKQPERKRSSMWDALQEQDLDPAAQLVAKYNGSEETTEITKWISHIIRDGDSRDLPHYRTRTPELVSVDSQPIWSKGVQSLPSASSLNQRFRGFITKIHDLTVDPRVGPFLLLGALMSFGSIWLRRSQSTPQPGPPNPPNLTNEREERREERAREVSSSSSITDEEPKNASQIHLSDSDSE